MDETYKNLRNKLKNDEEITASDLKEALKLYENAYIDTQKAKLEVSKVNLKLSKAVMRYRSWTDEEDEYIAYFVACNDTNLQEAADFLGRTLSSVENRLAKLRQKGKILYMRREWTEEEDEYIEKTYYLKSADYIAYKLNRSVFAVRNRASKLGVSEKLPENRRKRNVSL